MTTKTSSAEVKVDKPKDPANNEDSNTKCVVQIKDGTLVITSSNKNNTKENLKPKITITPQVKYNSRSSTVIIHDASGTQSVTRVIAGTSTKNKKYKNKNKSKNITTIGDSDSSSVPRTNTNMYPLTNDTTTSTAATASYSRKKGKKGKNKKNVVLEEASTSSVKTTSPDEPATTSAITAPTGSKQTKHTEQKQNIVVVPPTVPEQGWLSLAAPSILLSQSVRSVLDTVISSQKNQDHIVHIQRGLEQIQTYMRQAHTDKDGHIYPTFEAFVSAESLIWQQHVEVARKNKDMKATRRQLQSTALRLNMSAWDLKVGRPGRPDDSVYQASEYARKFMPRGNFIAEWTSPTSESVLYFPLLRAYRKFTGQEDDAEEKAAIGAEVLSKFFTKPMSQASSIISTTKENGEAAHLAILQRSDNTFLYVVGSKNTHMVIDPTVETSIDEARVAGIAGNQNDPYQVCQKIARAMVRTINTLDPKKRSFLCAFLSETRLTASFEMLCPDYQHVQLLDYLDGVETPVFYGFSLPIWDVVVPGTEICVNPILAYTIMDWIGFRRVEYSIIPYTPETVTTLLSTIRCQYQHEGAVNLYVDEDACVIGMEKYKSVWYVCLRAIREKSKSFLYNLNSKKQIKESRNYVEDILISLRKRFRDIQRYLQLSDDVNNKYLKLGEEFIKYLYQTQDDEKKTIQERVTTMFPVVWKEFIQYTGHNDQIS